MLSQLLFAALLSAAFADPSWPDRNYERLENELMNLIEKEESERGTLCCFTFELEYDKTMVVISGEWNKTSSSMFSSCTCLIG